MTLVGFLRPPSMNMYSAPERVTQSRDAGTTRASAPGTMIPS
jgi:hypothetical protein